MFSFKSILIALLLISSLNSHAETTGDTLSLCLADSTSGRDRKDLAVWVFTALATHPEIEKVMPVSEKNKINSEKKAGEIYTRLIAEDCKAEILQSKNSPMAIKKAFESLGKIAMMELLNDANVMKSIQGVGKYMDHQKIQNAINTTKEAN